MRTRGATRSGLLWATVAACLATAPFGVHAQQDLEPQEPALAPRVEPAKHLRLMLLDLADLREPDSTTGFEAPASTFRHTFGSQRRNSDEVRPPIVDPEALESDVVLLRGIADIQTTRRMFPARDWRLLLARDALTDARTSVDAASGPKKQASAIALWLQPGVRWAGVDLSLPVGFGVAMRVVSGLGTLWLLAPSDACRAAQSGPRTLCRPLEDWISAKLAVGDLALVGGLLPPVPQPTVPAQSESAPAPASERKPPARATPLAPRRHAGSIQLTGADAAGRCGGDARATPALHLRIADKSERKPPIVTGYVLPFDPPTPPAGPASRPPVPPRPTACALLLDIEVAP